MAKITDKFCWLYYIKLDQDTLCILAAEFYAILYGVCIKKQHCRKYQIVQKRSNQHQYYKKGRIDKNKISKYRHSTTLKRVVSVGI